MRLQTASEGIAFAKSLEEESKALYELLGERFPEHAEPFRALAMQNEKNWKNTQRAYYGVISDALEGCFAFAVEPEDYAFGTELPQKESHAKALQRAIEMEERVRKFYVDAAEQSKSLMADVPRTFALIAKKRDQRLSVLRSLLGKGA